VDEDNAELLRRIARAVGVTLPVSGTDGLTVGRLWLAFKSSLAPGRRKRQIRAELKPFLLAFWDVPCADLTPADWDRHRIRMLKTRTRYGRCYLQSTINLALTRARQMFRFGVDERLLHENPLRKAKRIRTRIGRETWLQPDQVDALIAAADSLRWEHQRVTARAFITVLLDTGMRFNEARRLRRDRIGLDGTVALAGAETKGKRPRVVALTRRAMRAVADVPPHPTTPYVFTHYRKARLWGQETLRDWFRQACELAGVDAAAAAGDNRIVPHDCRHTFASLADARGAQATMIQEVLGHSSLRTTERYLHRSRAETAKAVAAMMEPRRGPRRAAQKSERPAHEEVDKLGRAGAKLYS